MIYVFLRVLPFKHQELCLLKNSLIDTWDLTYDISWNMSLHRKNK